MHRIGDKVYFIRESIIADGFIVGIATFTVKGKCPIYLYLVGKTDEIKTNVAITSCFSGEYLPDYWVFPDTALFESVDALQKRQKELYLLSKGCKDSPFS